MYAGSPQKMELMAERLRLGQPLHQSGDPEVPEESLATVADVLGPQPMRKVKHARGSYVRSGEDTDSKFRHARKCRRCKEPTQNAGLVCSRCLK